MYDKDMFVTLGRVHWDRNNQLSIMYGIIYLWYIKNFWRDVNAHAVSESPYIERILVGSKNKLRKSPRERFSVFGIPYINVCAHS